jgi:hypothetical protein
VSYNSGTVVAMGSIVNDQVRRFPIGGFQRWRNALGKRAVPCIVSNRWLQFPEKSDHFEDGEYPDGDYVFVDVLTTTSGGTHKKLCTLCIAKTDLLAAIGEVDKEQQPPIHPPPEAGD